MKIKGQNYYHLKPLPNPQDPYLLILFLVSITLSINLCIFLKNYTKSISYTLILFILRYSTISFPLSHLTVSYPKPIHDLLNMLPDLRPILAPLHKLVDFFLSKNPIELGQVAHQLADGLRIGPADQVNVTHLLE